MDREICKRCNLCRHTDAAAKLLAQPICGEHNIPCDIVNNCNGLEHQTAEKWKLLTETSCYICTANSGPIASCTTPEIAARIVLEHNSHDALVEMLKAAKCPCCDGSGGYYDNHGEPTQCQWCYESKAALALAEVKP